MLKNKRKYLYVIIGICLALVVFVFFKEIEYRYVNNYIIKYANQEKAVVELCENLLDSYVDGFEFDSCTISFKDTNWQIEFDNSDTELKTVNPLVNSFIDQLKKLDISNDTNISVFQYDEGSTAIVFKKAVKFMAFDIGHLWIYYGDETVFPNCPDPKSSYRLVVKFGEKLYYDYYSNLLDFFFKGPPFLKDDNFIIVE